MNTFGKIAAVSLALIMGGLVLSGCASTEYYGDNYPMTSHVDVYWDAGDVKGEYRVIGRAVTSEGFGDSDDMVASIREEAMKRGAHGVIITEMDSVERGTTHTGKDSDDIRHSSTEREERIESKFIRYEN